MINFNRKGKNMMKINFEFRKGIFFIRLIGDMNKENYMSKTEEIKDLIINNKFKYIVLNTNYINSIDMDSLMYLIELYDISKNIDSNLVICDKTNIIGKLFDSNIPNIKEEIEVL